MGGVKDQLLSETEEQYFSLASQLNVSWLELEELKFKLISKRTQSGDLLGYTVQFSEDNDPEILSKIKGLDLDSQVELPPWALDLIAEENYQLSAISHNLHHRDNFRTEVEKLRSLNQIDLPDPETQQVLFRQVFVGTITALETYLSDCFIGKTLSSHFNVERFIATHPEFKKQKISLSEIFTEKERITEKAKSVMISTIYHKLPVVKNMYESTFVIDFPEIREMQKYIAQRHDLVHRNGKKVSGERILLTKDVVDKLITDVSEFVENVSFAMECDVPF